MREYFAVQLLIKVIDRLTELVYEVIEHVFVRQFGNY